MKKLIFILVFLCVLFNTYPATAEKNYFASRQKLAINKIEANNQEIGQYELFELTIDLSATYDNPFDPEEIDLSASFFSPSAKQIVVPGFFYQDFIRKLVNGAEELGKNGPPIWKIRFAPREIGMYRYYLTVKDRNGSIKSEINTFQVTASLNPGFIHVGQNNPYYLQFDDGQSYFAVGESIAWAKEKQTYDYDHYFDKLSENKANYSRLWMVPWSLALEWTKQPEAEGIFYGLGKYSLDNAWRLDYIFNLAKEKGIYLMLSLGNYGDLMAEKGYWNEQRWQFNPYNLINDGPCQELEEFWTKEIAKKYYKNKLRYILARWGYSTNLLSLEFFNEVDAPIEWVKEMGGFVKTNDPGQHLLTISPSHSFSPNYSEAKIWGLPEIDYTQIHLYGHQGKNIDLINELTNKCLLNTSKFKKPCLVAEFGIDSSRDDRIYDPQGLGVNIHQGLWTAAMSGSFGGAMNWWWDTYVEAKNLYYHYKVLANFAQTIDWNKSGWQKAEFSLEQKTIPDNSGEGTFSNLIITPEDSWGNTDYKEFTISNNGEMNGGKVNSFLHGYEKESIRLKPIFHVNYPQDGKFILRLGTVSKKAVLNICLDDKCVSSKELPTGPEGTGHWKKSEYKRQWDRYFCLYDEDCEINIPKGRHMISLENTGSDWVSIEQITLTNYVSSSYPNIRCLGLTREKEAIVWFQNKDNNWYNNYKRIEIKPLKDISLNLLNMSDGYYNIEWWDTYKGEIIYRERVISKNGCLAINIPELTTDIAAKINKL